MERISRAVNCVLMCVCMYVCMYVLQKSWSGEKFKNKDWAVKNGDGKAYIKA